MENVMQITKEIYKNLMEDEPWNDIKKNFADVKPCEIIRI